MTTTHDGPVRLDVGEVPGELCRRLGEEAAPLLVLPMMIEIDRAANPSVPVGELLARRVTESGVADLIACVRKHWPQLATADESVVFEVLEVVNDWADHLMGEAMTAARIRGGAADVLAA